MKTIFVRETSLERRGRVIYRDIDNIAILEFISCFGRWFQLTGNGRLKDCIGINIVIID